MVEDLEVNRECFWSDFEAVSRFYQKILIRFSVNFGL